MAQMCAAHASAPVQLRTVLPTRIAAKVQTALQLTWSDMYLRTQSHTIERSSLLASSVEQCTNPAALNPLPAPLSPQAFFPPEVLGSVTQVMLCAALGPAPVPASVGGPTGKADCLGVHRCRRD
jgi:hypothetical protein